MSYHNARTNMVKQQLRTGDVLNESILSLYDRILRHDFVPEQFADFAYSDMQIPLNHHQRMLTPLEEGKILQALDLKGHETVLEVGTGSGFFTALLSKLCHQVLSVDYYSDFTDQAARKLKEYECTNVELVTGDAFQGWLDEAPYDVVVFTGALEKITETHRLLVLPGGKLFAILGKSPIMQGRLYELSHDEVWQEFILFETNVPPLIDKAKPKEFVF
jgi:protein-L-isoaspartate(D-aspartate) O-methyltransferase